MVRVKGTGWKGNLEYIVTTYGQEGVERVKEGLDPADRETLFGQPVLATSWVDFGANTRFLLAADKVLGIGDLAVVKRAAEYNARKDLGGVYRLVLPLVSPETVATGAFKLWTRYYDAGRFTIVESSRKRVLARLDDVPDIPRQHDIAQIAYMRQVLRLAGATEPVGRHTSCMARGDACCLFELVWK